MPKIKWTIQREPYLIPTTENMERIIHSMAEEINQLLNNELAGRSRRPFRQRTEGILDTSSFDMDSLNPYTLEQSNSTTREEQDDPFIEEFCTWPPNVHDSDNSIPRTYARKRRERAKSKLPHLAKRRTTKKTNNQLSFPFMMENNIR